MKKYYLAFLAFILLASIGMVVYGKANIGHMTYEDFLNSLFTTDANYNLGNMGYDPLTIEDQNIEITADSLMDYSDLVLIINVEKEPEFAGKSIRNCCKVEKVMKGNYSSEEIYIENFVFNWQTNNTNFYGNLTPLKIGERYLVFLKQYKHAVHSDSYFFSSYTYGHININQPGYYIWDEVMSVEESQNYDCIYDRNRAEDIDFELYTQIVDELLNRCL